jgi:hypothetical protein
MGDGRWQGTTVSKMPSSIFHLPYSIGVRAALLVLAATLACSRPAIYTIGLNSQLKTIDVGGVPAAALAQLARIDWTDAQWQALMQVSVKAPSAGTADDSRTAASRPPAIVGRYAVADGVLRFTPMFPFDDGREYDVRFDPSRLPGSGATPGAASLAATVTLPAVVRTPSTIVTRVYPSGTAVPANQLRMYLHFSAPMDWRSGYEYLTLVDDGGHEVDDAFLPLDADFWNHDRTRYTVFFDPGRVKRGILPNRQMGRALVAGRRYTLVIKRAWRDGHGQPLKEEFRHAFTAVPAIERPLAMADWRVDVPAAGTRDPLSVTFPAALDHGLLQRALGVARDGAPLEGDVTIEPGETCWRFTPREAWREARHQLVALEFLEDLAGNRIGRAFEVDNFERTDRTPQPERHVLAFDVGVKR